MNFKSLLFYFLITVLYAAVDPTKAAGELWLSHYCIQISILLGPDDDYYYYYNTDVDDEEEPYEIFAITMCASAILIVVQIFITIFGPVMKDLPIRWHTLNYCCWNVFQLIVFSNCTEASVFKSYLKNSWIESNCDDVQVMTLSIFICCKLVLCWF